MAYQALYRKYRPQTFSDVVGQEHITETLKSELANGKSVHAYLFTGTRGTGKTSCAKILANSVNCLNSKNGDPCLECESCRSIAEGENTDIVEIDAASNNGVENIRELRDRVAFAPSNSKYRVYIIDEVHMLSTSAFNALLKTLEEPPAHVIFILATTEVHKLPATILSRCQRFDFRRIDAAKICERIQYIAEKEGLTVTPGAASLIAAAADGGMRDALSILDLCSSGAKVIDEKVVESSCGMAGTEYLLQLAQTIKNKDTEAALLLIDRLYGGSVDMQRLLSELTNHYRDLMIIKTIKSGNRPIVCTADKLKALESQAEDYDIKDIMYALSLLQAAAEAMQNGNRRSVMEMTIIRLCNPALSNDISALERRVSALEEGSFIPKEAPKQKKEKVVAPDKKEEPSVAEVKEEKDDKSSTEENSPVDNDISPVPESKWKEILLVIKKNAPLMHGVLTGSKAYIKGQFLLIDAPNSQFRSLINNGNTQYKDCIRKAAHTVLGEVYKLGPYAPKKVTEEADPLAELAEKLKHFEIN